MARRASALKLTNRYIGPKIHSGFVLERLYDRYIQALAKPFEKRTWWDNLHIRSVRPLFMGAPVEGVTVRLCDTCSRAVYRSQLTKEEWRSRDFVCQKCREA